ncbi:hypothetical protein ES707_06535 [subsurface metagenome]
MVDELAAASSTSVPPAVKVALRPVALRKPNSELAIAVPDRSIFACEPSQMWLALTVTVPE